MKLRTLQWNIGGGKIRDIDADPTQELDSLIPSYSEDGLDYVISKIKEYDADIITLQEAHADKNIIQAKIIAEKLGYTYWINNKYADSHIEEGQDLCQAIISKYPISKPTFELFINPHFETTTENGKLWLSHDKGCTSALVTLPNKENISVATLHIVPFRRFKREYNDTKVLEILKDVSLKVSQTANEKTLIQGDFNIDDSSLKSYLPLLLSKVEEVAATEPTTPKGRRYDHVLYKDLNFIENRIDNNVLTDHYPIISEFELISGILIIIKKAKAYIRKHPKLKKAVGIILIVVGLLALVTPLTPGSWLALIGLELLGVRILFLDKLRLWLASISGKHKDKQDQDKN